jgi:hypothetical protein
MLKCPTIFVLGAGASFDFGFPLGEELKDDIKQLLSDFVSDIRNEKSIEIINFLIKVNNDNPGSYEKRPLHNSLYRF